MEKQMFLEKQKVNYSFGPYNKIIGDEQQIRLTEGCPNNCPYCYEPTEKKIFNIPKIERNNVRISDMNLLCKKEAIEIIEYLGKQKVNNKVVYYELICGIDYRFLTQEIADLLNKNRFINIRIAWDWSFKEQKKIKNAIEMLKKAGYDSKDIMIFMICNWKIPYTENLMKLDLCKIWNIQLSDCYFDNQTFPNVVPIEWTDTQNKDFRHKVRKHNQLVNFKIDPEQ